MEDLAVIPCFFTGFFCAAPLLFTCGIYLTIKHSIRAVVSDND